MVRFSRRIDTADNEFDGIVLVAVAVRYFTSLIAPATLGAQGMVAMVGAESTLRVEQRGDGSITAGSAASILPASAARWLGGSGNGVALINGCGAFADGAARMLGWQQSKAYPLIALVGLSHNDAVAGALDNVVKGASQVAAQKAAGEERECVPKDEHCRASKKFCATDD
ncbi:MAG: hypothetical protein H7335_10860 [Massilia sp.]|nr:hypothetical protein [Massilia sp.]